VNTGTPYFVVPDTAISFVEPFVLATLIKDKNVPGIASPQDDITLLRSKITLP